MKKIAFALTFLATLLACSSDDPGQRTSGQYVFQNDTLTMAIEFADYNAAKVHIFVRNSIEYQDIRTAHYTGEYPNCTVYAETEDEPLTIACKFSSSDEFTGNVTSASTFSYYFIYGLRQITVPQNNAIQERHPDT